MKKNGFTQPLLNLRINGGRVLEMWKKLGKAKVNYYITIKARAGFSLIELLVVMLIFVSIFVATFGILTVGRKSWQIGNAQVEVQQEARRAMDVMIKELRGASSIDQATFTDGVSSNIIRFNLSGATIEYALNGSILEKTVATVTTFVANDIAAVQFNLLGGDMLHIVLTAQKTSLLGDSLDTTINSQVMLRN